MKFAVDRIEENIVILENIETQEILEINIENFEDVKEKEIYELIEGRFVKNEQIQKNREQIIKEKMDKLKRLD